MDWPAAGVIRMVPLLVGFSVYPNSMDYPFDRGDEKRLNSPFLDLLPNWRLSKTERRLGSVQYYLWIGVMQSGSELKRHWKGYGNGRANIGI